MIICWLNIYSLKRKSSFTRDYCFWVISVGFRQLVQSKGEWSFKVSSRTLGMLTPRTTNNYNSYISLFQTLVKNNQELILINSSKAGGFVFFDIGALLSFLANFNLDYPCLSLWSRWDYKCMLLCPVRESYSGQVNDLYKIKYVNSTSIKCFTYQQSWH